LYAAVLDVDLVAFDDADFTELVERVAQQSIDRIRVATRATGDLLASLVSMVAAVVAAGLLHPLLAPLMLLVAVPQGWASIIEARMSLGSWVRMLSNHRRLAVAGDLLTDRGSAGEVRAYTAQEVLLAEHRRIATRLMIEEVALGRRRTLVQLAGRALTGVGTALAFVVLGLLIYTGVPLALAGAAAVAMRVASQAVSATPAVRGRLLR
jgi:ATP-binding cassette, subfamily B, bacterial